jgi:cysteine-rich repeat protein
MSRKMMMLLLVLVIGCGKGWTKGGSAGGVPDGGGGLDAGSPGSADGPAALLLDGRVLLMGQPASGARVEILGTSLLTVTGTDGRFVLPAAPSRGDLLVKLDGNSDGSAEYQVLRPFDLGAATKRSLLEDLVLERAGSIAGRVTEDGAPAPLGTLVFVPGSPWLTTADADGNYVLGPLAAGTFTVAGASITGGRTGQAEGVLVQAGAETRGVALALRARAALGSVRGEAAPADGTDAAGTTLELVGSGRSATTAADGSYEVSDVPAGLYALVASRAGYREVAIQNLLVGDGVTTVRSLVLHPSDDPGGPVVTFTGPAAGSELGEPFEITVEATGPRAIAAVELTLDDRVLVTDISAPFSVRVDPAMLPAGPHVLGAYAKDTSAAYGTARRLVRFASVCGNGTRQGAEECDRGSENADSGACTSRCTLARCGDGLAQAGREVCDDGNALDGDGCDGNCKPTGCGNGLLTTGEHCDDGNTASGDGCEEDCTRTCDCDPTNPCLASTCDPATGACRNQPAPDGTRCANQRECRSGACRSSNGASCTAAAACASGQCADGLCCDAACIGACEACNLPGRGGA